MRSIMIVSLSIIVMSSCQTKGTADDTLSRKAVDFNDFSIIDMSGKGQFVADNPDILGIVSSIEAVDDSMLAICQNNSNAHVSLYNLNDGAVRTAMTRGEGPGEMLRVSTMSSDKDGTLWLAGLMDRKVMTVRRDEDGNIAIDPAFRMPEDYLRGVTDFAGGIIGLPSKHHTYRLMKLDAAGQEVDSMVVFPDVEMPADVAPVNFMFQSDMAYSPEANKVALACKSWNYIDIVDLSSNGCTTLVLPVDQEIKLEKFEMGDAKSYNPRPFWLTASGVDATSESFFVGYIGVKVTSPEDLDRNIGSILEFDWNGKPLRSYRFANELMAFSVSHDGKILYTVENNPDPIIYQYLLDK